MPPRVLFRYNDAPSRRRNPREACPVKLMKYEYLGTTDEVTTCDCCGKTGLKNTVAIRDLDEGEVLYFGVTCAARALKVQVADVKKGAADADRQRREEEYRRRSAENAANAALWQEWLIERTGGIYDYNRYLGASVPDVLRMIQALGGFAAARVGFEDWKAAKKARTNPRRRTSARRNPKMDSYPCSRCGGSGKLSGYSHVWGGVCFKCGGTGTQATKPSSKPIKWVVHFPKTVERPTAIDRGDDFTYVVSAKTPDQAVLKATTTFLGSRLRHEFTERGAWAEPYEEAYARWEAERDGE